MVIFDLSELSSNKWLTCLPFVRMLRSASASWLLAWTTMDFSLFLPAFVKHSRGNLQYRKDTPQQCLGEYIRECVDEKDIIKKFILIKFRKVYIGQCESSGIDFTKLFLITEYANCALIYVGYSPFR